MGDNPIVRKVVHFANKPLGLPGIGKVLDPLGIHKTVEGAFGKPEAPPETIAPLPTPDAPTPDSATASPDISAAGDAERKTKGRAASILAGRSSGYGDDTQSVSRRTLAGA